MRTTFIHWRSSTFNLLGKLSSSILVPSHHFLSIKAIFPPHQPTLIPLSFTCGPEIGIKSALTRYAHVSVNVLFVTSVLSE